jgi:hypothetical protein
MINSIEVYLGIKTSYPEVEHKNLFIFCYRIIKIDSAYMQNKSY